MTVQTVGVLGLGVLVCLILLRVPVAIAMGLVGLVGYAVVDGWSKALTVLGQTPFDVASGYALSVVPMFILMGEVATRAGISSQLYRAAQSVFSGTRGAQALATLGACAGFGAICGSSLATAATMTRIAIPEMRRSGYDDRLSTGAVAAGGTLGILLPPSIVLMVYAIITQQSVLKLFAAGLIPGLLLTLLYMAIVTVIVRVRPSWAPLEGATPWRKRLVDAFAAWELAILFGFSIGGLYAGWFSPTEAASVGAFSAFVLAAIRGRLSFKLVAESFASTILTTCMLFMIVIGAFIFSYFVVQTQLPKLLVDFVTSVHLGPIALIVMLVIFYIIMGCFLDGFGMIVITVPVFLPLILASGFDPVWFGVIVVMVIELGLIHPPVGMNIFVIQAQAADIPVVRIYGGILPFLLAPILLIAVLIAFPDIALWLPHKLYK